MTPVSAAIGTAPVARIRVRNRSGVFVATTCELRDGMVTAAGRFRWRTGADYQDFRHGPPTSYSWPVREIREIRWIEADE